ncbi:MAG: hypothetical protein ACK6DI_03900, partial [Betaproteobacteria bacterium]
MKLATFNYRGRRFLGRVSARAQTVTPLRMAADERGLTPLIEAMGEGKPGFPPEDAPLSLAEVCLEAPIPRPRRNSACSQPGRSAFGPRQARSSVTGVLFSRSMGVRPRRRRGAHWVRGRRT